MILLLIRLLLAPTLVDCGGAHCAALRSLIGGGQEGVPSFLAVISAPGRDGNVSWADELPMPFCVYDHAQTTTTTTTSTQEADHQHQHQHQQHHHLNGAEATSYLSFIVDHYECLPRWLLFLDSSRGHRFHPLSPAWASALVHVDEMSMGFVALGHISSAATAVAQLSAPAAGFSAAAPPRTHRAAWVAQEEGSAGCECFIAAR